MSRSGVCYKNTYTCSSEKDPYIQSRRTDEITTTLLSTVLFYGRKGGTLEICVTTTGSLHKPFSSILLLSTVP